MCEHEDGHVERWVLPPPSGPWIFAPRAGSAPELPPAHDLGADVRLGLLEDGVARVHLAALPPVALAEGLQREGPFVQTLAALAERVLLALVRPGRVPVRRHRDMEI